jgi:alpha-aminoadipic semialdehyde synthase
MSRIGVRREDKNEWERRAPLTPDHVAELGEQHGIRVSIQPAPQRAFPDKDYVAAGAHLDEALEDCRIVIGIKEIPLTQLRPRGVYLFFSHTTKGQPHNMPMLARLLGLGCTLVDFEHVVDERGRRLIFFGRYAGHAGMIDGLWALGRRLAAEGHVTPFERVRLAHDYSTLDEATHHIHRVGEELRHAGLPEALHPLVCAFTGSGNVSRGAQEIFDRLPQVEIASSELAGLAADRRRSRNVVYRVHFDRATRFARVGGGPLDEDELARHPERYRSGLGAFLPHVTFLVHGAFWRPGHPRVLSLDDLRELWRGRAPLRVVADISCDIGGGIEATVRATTPGDPVYVYDVAHGETMRGVAGDGPVILAVDNLPCQLPVEASEHFADTLAHFVPALVDCDWEAPLGALALPRELVDAVVVHRGALAPRFAHLDRHLGPAERGGP